MKKTLVGAMTVLAVVGAGAGANAVAGHGHPTARTAARSAVAQQAQQAQSAEATDFTQPTGYAFSTLNDPADTTFNQLLGINARGVIAGYFGSGAQGHPNQGYQLQRDGRTFRGENVTGSVQTQVTGLNDHGVTVGFWSAMNNANQTNDNTGFYAVGGRFHNVAFPTADNAAPPVNQLLGVNNDGTAVGFYTDAAGNNHGYTYDIEDHSFHQVAVTGATSVTAAAINNHADIAGFFTGAGGTVDGYLLRHGRLTTLAFPGASMTQALGVNDSDEVVGVYQVGSGNAAKTHGFTWTSGHGFGTVDDPNGVGATTVNGVNDAGALVGFYTDAAGNTDGMLATPQRTTSVRHLTLHPMPAGSVAFSHDSQGQLRAQLHLYGLTPGSPHQIDIEVPGHGTATVVGFGVLSADATGQADATLTAASFTGSLPSGSRLLVHLGTVGGGANGDPMAAEPIARTAELPSRPGGDEFTLSAVDVAPNGADAGRLSGRAAIAYDAAARTLKVTVNATGLTPGAHAAHIHLGSCQVQGGVKYMLTDLQADAQGNIVDQTRTITGVTAAPPVGGWYLNVHQGDSNTILANGSPAPGFRPLLCANI
ncbi:hypothetical protein ABIA33_002178 [Streptacidiphilus sp. MAP12-16]|uniref:CHRD domain-containing protein n=1 Tax=Streptacidiphilus sp. MAP12-16 TaxID=3156300 RepID=UPI003515CED2